jgi:hypothetical protein
MYFLHSLQESRFGKEQENGEDCMSGSFMICPPEEICFLNNSRRIRWPGLIARKGEKRTLTVFGGKPARKRQLGRPICR